MIIYSYVEADTKIVELEAKPDTVSYNNSDEDVKFRIKKLLLISFLT
ncbi:MAG: hypothetical protein KJN64_15915 [Ignavibacteria bacterium]|nr:hypothetical protein [Ignavibacteria bacterium]MBT8393154.1 hypothetical protein [Ignavibacteria bacterium]NNJ51834.1 hypothetical protein [Ignavibacteriaceae bacterium]NNL20908.1 hypothetical protein [Ignavibacteriaceae bacterium]